MKLTSEILTYIEEHRQEAEALLIELAKIPAPSHREERRAAFCKAWLEEHMERDSILPGLQLSFEMILHHF